MNRPDKAGEPSMEEILASIRQIIADEPSTDTSEPAIDANPLVPQSSSIKPSEPRVPLADRLSDVIKNGSLPPTSPLGSKRPLSFDQDLADMFDEEVPSNGSPVVAPKPDIRVPTALSHPMATKSFVQDAKREEPLKPSEAPQAPKDEAVKPPVADSAAAEAAQPPSSPQPLASPSPFGGAEKPAAAPSQPTYGFPPLRKTSFYPPQPQAPVAPRSVEPDAAAAARLQSPAPSVESVADAPSNDADQVGQGSKASGFGAVIAGEPDGASEPLTADPAHVPQPFTSRAPAAQNARYEAPDVPLSPFASSAPSRPAPASSFEGAQYPQHDATPAGPPPGMPRPHAPASERSAEARPAEPRAYADPFGQGARPHTGRAEPNRFAGPPLSNDAAHQALDALAQGLAASAAGAPPSVDSVSPAIPLTPVFDAPEPEPEAQAQPAAPSTLPAPIANQGTMPVNRTLEDAVADMLRPMLQQWVAENMPRIIERALRTEVAQTVRPGNKPPGT